MVGKAACKTLRAACNKARAKAKVNRGPGPKTRSKVLGPRSKDKGLQAKGSKAAPVYIYGRISSQKQVDQQGLSRQRSACLPKAKKVGQPKMVSEVISGSLALEQRKMLQKLLTGAPKQVFVESARAIARNALVGEQAYQLAKQHAVQIIPSDIPNLFTHFPTPGETFMRHVMLAVQELERDMIRERLTAGLQKAMETSTKVTQKGRTKVNGCKSILEKCRPSTKTLNQMRAAAAKWNAGAMSCRSLRDAFKGALKKKGLGVMTAERMVSELQVKFSAGQRSKVHCSRSKVCRS